MIRRPPRSTRVRSSAASDVYKRQMTISFLDGTKDVRVTSSIVPPLLIVNLDNRFRIEINRHKDPDGTQGFLLGLQILAQEDRRMHLFVEDVTCVDD